jgi:hypothetical protein
VKKHAARFVRPVGVAAKFGSAACRSYFILDLSSQGLVTLPECRRLTPVIIIPLSIIIIIYISFFTGLFLLDIIGSPTLSTEFYVGLQR